MSPATSAASARAQSNDVATGNMLFSVLGHIACQGKRGRGTASASDYNNSMTAPTAAGGER